MNLFNIEELKSKKHIKNPNQKRDFKESFKKELASLLKVYLQGKISYLIYIDKLYEIHKHFKRPGYTKTDLLVERNRFFKRAC